MHAYHNTSCKGIRVPWWEGLYIGLKTVLKLLNFLCLFQLERLLSIDESLQMVLGAGWLAFEN